MFYIYVYMHIFVCIVGHTFLLYCWFLELQQKSKIGGKMELIVFQKSVWQLIVFGTRILYAVQHKWNLYLFKHMGQIYILYMCLLKLWRIQYLNSLSSCAV